jgi:hypothetical protein
MQFFRLRSKTRESIDFTANVSNRDVDPVKCNGASDALRDVGIRIFLLFPVDALPINVRSGSIPLIKSTFTCLDATMESKSKLRWIMVALKV